MIIDGRYTFAGSRQTVYDLLHDPEVLAKALPGTKALTRTGDDSYEGVMTISVGPVNAAEFAVKVQLYDQTPPERFSMRIDGKGNVGFARGTANVALGDHENGSIMNYHADLQIGGKLAAVGQRLLDSTGRMMTRQALESLARELDARLQPATIATEAPVPAPSGRRKLVRLVVFGGVALLVLSGVGYCVGMRP